MRSKPFFIQSLWRWTKKNAKISRLITTNLKGVYDEQRWLPFSSLLLARSQRLPEKSVIIPIPSKRAKQGDHATGFATALSRLTGAAVHECLMPANERRQRGLNRKERLEIRFVKVASLPRRHLVVIVDDVVTTGATLQAAYVALGKPAHVQGFCLVDRDLN